MPDALNPSIKSTREYLFLNCYFKDKTANVFLGSEVVLCRNFQKVVKKFLNLSNYGNRSIKISVIDPGGVEGNSFPLNTEFKILKLKKVTNLLISSKDERKNNNLPLISIYTYLKNFKINFFVYLLVFSQIQNWRKGICSSVLTGNTEETVVLVS